MSAPKVFAISTEPHEVVIGDVSLWFVPEANGAAFLEAYSRLRVSSDKLVSSSLEKDDAESFEDIREILDATRLFVNGFLMPESVDVFRNLDFPIRILTPLVEYLAELYGGGSVERPTGSSSGSAARRKSPGKRG